MIYSEIAQRVLRKKVLLQILAVQEARRLGIDVTPEETQAIESGFRQAFGLETDEALAGWLRAQSLSLESFRLHMSRFAAVEKIESYFAPSIEEALPDMRRMDSARARAARGA